MALPLNDPELTTADALSRTAGVVVPQWRSGFSQASDIEFRELLEQLTAAAYTTDATPRPGSESS